MVQRIKDAFKILMGYPYEMRHVMTDKEFKKIKDGKIPGLSIVNINELTTKKKDD